MENCFICGHELRVGTKFCSACGNNVTTLNVQLDNDISIETCVNCEEPLTADDMFCAMCGTAVEEVQLLDSSVVVDALLRILTPFGTTVLSDRPDRRKAQRLQVTANEEGLLTAPDKIKLQNLLAEQIYVGSYLASEVTLSSKNTFCVWHLIGGDVFPLKSDHAEAVVLSYESLLPSTTRFEDLAEIVDAPSLERGINSLEN